MHSGSEMFMVVFINIEMELLFQLNILGFEYPTCIAHVIMSCSANAGCLTPLVRFNWILGMATFFSANVTVSAVIET